MSTAIALTDLESQLPGLRAAYERAAAALLDLAQKQTKKAERERFPAFHAWHAAGVTLFNAHDRVIADGSVKKSDHNAAWYTDRCETSANVLQTIGQHYRTLRDWATEWGLDLNALRPSLTAFANMQRLVQETHPDIARRLRDEFVRLDLPTHGFDTAASEKPRPPKLEWRHFIVGCVLGMFSIGMAIWGFSLGNLTKDQRLILNWLFPLTSAFAAWGFAGSFSAKTKGWQGFAIAATGGFGVWLLSNFLLFRE